MKTWQFYGLVFLFICSAQSGLLVIGNATPDLEPDRADDRFSGRERLDLVFLWWLRQCHRPSRHWGLLRSDWAADLLPHQQRHLCSFPVSHAGDHGLRKRAVAFSRRRHRLLAIRRRSCPTARLDGRFLWRQNLGFNYGLVFIGWGIAFFVPQLAGYIEDWTGSLDSAFYLSGGLLVAAILLSFRVRRPLAVNEQK